MATRVATLREYDYSNTCRLELHKRVIDDRNCKYFLKNSIEL